MKKAMLAISVISGMSILSASVSAATSYMSARNDAMGGVGVASSHYGTAALANPALIARYNNDDDFSLILPALGVQLSDPDNLVDNADEVENLWDRFDNAIKTQQKVPESSAALVNKLKELKNTYATAQAAAAVAATVPNETLPYAMMVKSWGTATVEGKITDSDLAYLDHIVDGTIAPSAVDTDALTSRAYARAAVVTDVGIAFARWFESNSMKWSLGITPKYQRVDLMNYNVGIQDVSDHDFKANKYRNTYTDFNADIGIAGYMSTEWTVGLALQNIISRSMKTKEVNGVKETFHIKPQATLGTAWSNRFVTAAFDVDLSEASGFDGDSKRQFAAAGLELNGWDLVKLRAGYRHNIAASTGHAFTSGLGFSPFGIVHLDLTGMVGEDRTYGAVAQLQFTF